MNKTATLHIPEMLYSKLEELQHSSIFQTVDEMAVFILQEYLDNKNKTPGPDAQDEEQIIKERLKNLGYL